MTNSEAPIIGILGDGQLALMLGESARSQGVNFLAFGENINSSFANSFPDNFILGNLHNHSEVIAFAKLCSVITLENEFLPSELLKIIESETGTLVIPDSSSYQNFESKISQREFFQSLKIPSPKWAIGKLDFPYSFVLKANRGGYDGYGVRIVNNAQQLDQALLDLKHTSENPVLVEEKVSIAREFAQGALFDGKGGMVMLPLVETIQRNGICELVLSKSTLAQPEFESVKSKIESILFEISKCKIKGLFNFEFFYTTQGDVLINEGAPRPHNSQHLSLNASIVSQFDLLISFLAKGLLPKLDSPILAIPGVMINLLGKVNGLSYDFSLPTLPQGIEAFPKLYGKKESRIGRKMGHLNVIDQSGSHDLLKLGERLLIWSKKP